MSKTKLTNNIFSGICGVTALCCFRPGSDLGLASRAKFARPELECARLECESVTPIL